MNPMTNVKNILRMNQLELDKGLSGSKTSWHEQYKDSAWIFVGGLPYDLTEGDIICVFSQYGEIVNINLVRDKATGKSKGYCFICYEDQRSTILTVDNFNGIKILNRTLRVDHVQDYKPPKETGEEDDLTKQIRTDGVAPKMQSSSEEEQEEEEYVAPVKKAKKEKKKKKKKEKKKTKSKKESSSESSDSSDSDDSNSAGETDRAYYKSMKVKQEKEDSGYMKYSNERHTDSRDKLGYRENGEKHGRERGRDKDIFQGRAYDKNSPRHYDEKDSYRERNRRPEYGRDRDGATRGMDSTWSREREGPNSNWNRDRSGERDHRDFSRERRGRSQDRNGDRSRERERRLDWDRSRDRDNSSRGQDRSRERDYGRDRDRRY